MKTRLPVFTTALVLIACMSACGGGGGSKGSGPLPNPSPSSNPTPTSSNPPQATPTPASIGTYTFHVITLVAGVSTTSIGVFPVANPTLPSGATLGPPAANAVVTYPDGSSQIADANGFFQASASSYVKANAQAVETNAANTPYVRVSDATGAAQPTGANVAAVAASASSNRIVGLTVAPAGSEIFTSGSVLFIAQGTSVDDLVSAPGSTVTWSDTAGGTFTQIGSDSSQELFTPASGISSPTMDTVTAQIHVPGVPSPYSATAQISILPMTMAATVSGTVSGATANASADFVLDDTSHLFPSYNFLGLTDANGNYSVTLPATQQFSAGILSPTNPNSSFVQATINGNTSYTSGVAGSNVPGVALLPQSTNFDDSRDDARFSAPDPIVSVRDVWQAAMLLSPAPWWADSGVLGVLGGATTAQPPAPVANGIFADWCYQWISSGGTTALAIIENTTATCSGTTAPGNIAFVMTPQGASSTFSYVEYRMASGAYTIGASLNPAQGAVLVATGQWTQSVTLANGSITADTASVTQVLFGPNSQISANGLSQTSFSYGYTSAGSSATINFSGVAFSDPVSSLPLGASSGIAMTRTGVVSACIGSAAPCYSATGVLNRTFNLAIGPSQTPYNVTDMVGGDGSSTTILTAQSAHSYVQFPIASATQRATASCLVCASNLGQLFDIDGNSQIGSFSANAQQVVTYQLLGTSEGSGGSLGSSIGTRVFGL